MKNSRMQLIVTKCDNPGEVTRYTRFGASAYLVETLKKAGCRWRYGAGEGRNGVLSLAQEHGVTGGRQPITFKCCLAHGCRGESLLISSCTDHDDYAIAAHSLSTFHRSSSSTVG